MAVATRKSKTKADEQVLFSGVLAGVLTRSPLPSTAKLSRERKGRERAPLRNKASSFFSLLLSEKKRREERERKM